MRFFAAFAFLSAFPGSELFDGSDESASSSTSCTGGERVRDRGSRNGRPTPGTGEDSVRVESANSVMSGIQGQTAHPVPHGVRPTVVNRKCQLSKERVRFRDPTCISSRYSSSSCQRVPTQQRASFRIRKFAKVRRSVLLQTMAMGGTYKVPYGPCTSEKKIPQGPPGVGEMNRGWGCAAPGTPVLYCMQLGVCAIKNGFISREEKHGAKGVVCDTAHAGNQRTACSTNAAQVTPKWISRCKGTPHSASGGVEKLHLPQQYKT